MTAAESIAAAVHAELTVPAMGTIPAARVFRDLEDALAADELQSVAVETGDEPDPEPAAIGQVDRVIDIRVTVVAKGSNPWGAADAAVVEIHGRLTANRTLSGLALRMDEGPTERARREGAATIGTVTKTYRYTYRTALNAL